MPGMMRRAVAFGPGGALGVASLAAGLLWLRGGGPVWPAAAAFALAGALLLRPLLPRERAPRRVAPLAGVDDGRARGGADGRGADTARLCERALALAAEGIAIVEARPGG